MSRRPVRTPQSANHSRQARPTAAEIRAQQARKKSEQKLIALLALCGVLLVAFVTWIIFNATTTRPEDNRQVAKKVARQTSDHEKKWQTQKVRHEKAKRRSLANLYGDDQNNDQNNERVKSETRAVNIAHREESSALWTSMNVNDKAEVKSVPEMIMPVNLPEVKDTLAPHAMSTTFDKTIKPFFETYCTQCHNEEKQKAKRRYDTLSFPIEDEDALIDFQDALDLLNLGEMPPEDEKQPETKLKLFVIDWLTQAIKQKQSEGKMKGHQTVLRRLSRREYRHTIGDLFHINMAHFDPTEAFPADQKVHHLDNQGEVLVTSGYLLDRYLKAADAIMNKALPAPEKPKVQTWHFTGGFFQEELSKFLVGPEFDRIIKPQLDKFKNKLGANYRQFASELRRFAFYSQKNWRQHLLRKIDNLADGKDAHKLKQLVHQAAAIPNEIRLYEHPRAERHNGCYGYISEFEDGVPADGYYDIALKVQAKHFKNPYKENYAGIRYQDPIQFGIVPGDSRIGSLHLPQEKQPLLYATSLPKSGEMHEVKARVWLDQGVSPRFIWNNGAHRVRSSAMKAARFELKGQKTKKNIRQQEFFTWGIANAKLPQIHIHEVRISGPHYESWPTKSQKALLDGGTRVNLTKPKQLQDFLKRAYRRPPTQQELASVLKVVKMRRSQGQSIFDAYRDGLKVALCSPAFIYMDEPAVPDESGHMRISPYAIASRLSYFLWSSMPDQELFDLAESGELLKPLVRRQQVRRMLQDPKSDRFINAFLDSWLTLSELGSTAPDRNRYKSYYADDLEAAMREETFQFTRHILDEKKSIMLFLDSDYTFANDALCRHYGLKDKARDFNFQKVSLRGSNRGGLLGQASVMTVTANGVDTSPVVRGVWLLENILGTPPTPPPPDVEPLDPDVRGAKTIREKLIKHRTDPACAECHRKIDPLGFAMENFDPIGGWRDNYRRGKVKAHGELPGGIKFDDINDFRKVLLKQRQKFARGLTEKLLSFGLGRSLSIHDRPQVDLILRDLASHGSKFDYLIERIVISELFVKP